MAYRYKNIECDTFEELQKLIAANGPERFFPPIPVQSSKKAKTAPTDRKQTRPAAPRQTRAEPQAFDSAPRKQS